MGGDHGYLASDTCSYCAELLQCFSEHDQEGLVRLQKSAKFNYLENPIVRIAKALVGEKNVVSHLPLFQIYTFC